MRIVLKSEETGYPAEWQDAERLWLSVQQFPPKQLIPWKRVGATMCLSAVFAVAIVYILMRGVQ